MLEFWDLVSVTSRQLVLEALAKREVSAVAISPDCRLIALAWRQGGKTNGAILLSLATGDLQWSASEIRSQINGIAFSPDGQWLALACMDGKVQMLRVESGAKGPEILCPVIAERPDFSADGKLMAVACWDGVRLFSMPDGKATATLAGGAFRARFSADGKTLVTHGGPLGRWWHLPTGRQMFSSSWPWTVVPESMILLNRENFAAGCFSSREGIPDEWDVFQLPPLEGAEEWLRSQPSNLTEARRQTCRIPRDPKTPSTILDLSAYYNADLDGNWHWDDLQNDLSRLPTGLQTFVGVRFDVRGLIQLGSRNDAGCRQFPKSVSGIPIGRPCHQIHFLHGLFWGSEPQGTEVGSYVIHYADGQTVERPVILGKDVLDWWTQPKEMPSTNGMVVAWEGSNEKSRKEGKSIRLFKSTWENPRPDVNIITLDLLSRMTEAAPFVVAITVE